MNAKHCLDCDIELGLHNWHPAARKQSQHRCNPCKNSRLKLWRENNKEHVKAYQAKWYLKNPDRQRKASREWRKNNSKYLRGFGAKRRARKLQRTPNWSNLDQIKQIYLNCPDNMTVDHIIPMQGEFVSGLHVPENLQYLDLPTNSAKHNYFDCFDYLEWVNNGGLENRFAAPYLPPHLRLKVA